MDQEEALLKLKMILPDYSCGGENWKLDINTQQQTPIDVPKEEDIEFEPNVELELLYKEMVNVSLANSFWTV
jgi:hypothetical protein